MTTSVIEAVTGVFDAMADWFVGMIPTITGIFYNAESGLSLLGVLAIASLAISVVFLVLGFIIGFFQFRAR